VSYVIFRVSYCLPLHRPRWHNLWPDASIRGRSLRPASGRL